MILTARLCDGCRTEIPEFRGDTWGRLAITGQTESGHHFAIHYCGLACAQRHLSAAETLDGIMEAQG